MVSRTPLKSKPNPQINSLQPHSEHGLVHSPYLEILPYSSLISPQISKSWPQNFNKPIICLPSPFPESHCPSTALVSGPSLKRGSHTLGTTEPAYPPSSFSFYHFLSNEDKNLPGSIAIFLVFTWPSALTSCCLRTASPFLIRILAFQVYNHLYHFQINFRKHFLPSPDSFLGSDEDGRNRA